MRRTIAIAIGSPGLLALCTAIVLFGGLFALLHLPSGLFPGLDIPVVNVISHFPGVSAEEMDLLVTQPLESRLRAVSGVKRVATRSIQDVSQVAVEFTFGTRLADARQLVQTTVAATAPNLPAGVTPRIENIGTTLEEVLGYVAYGRQDLRTFARKVLAPRLMDLPGVARVEVLGGDDPALVAALDPSALARNRLTLRSVASAVKAACRIVPGTYLDRSAREYAVRAGVLPATVDAVRSLPIPVGNGAPLLLGELAAVRKGVVPRHYVVTGNGRPAVAFFVSKQQGAGTIEVARTVSRAILEFAPSLPKGTRLRKFYDQSEIVSEARDALAWDLLIGASFAALVLILFAGTLRTALVVSATIPLSLAATLAVLALLGQSLNVITLAALTLAAGMVVDDAIVVTENVARHLTAARDPKRAALEGACEIAPADASGTFTTVAAFAPLLLLGGLAGVFVRPFGLTVSVALVASLVLSLTLVPALLAPGNKAATHKAPLAPVLSWFDSRLHHALSFAFQRRSRILVAFSLSLGLCGLAAWLGPISLLPPIDEGALLIEYIMPPGTSLRESDRIGRLIEARALADPDVSTVYRRTGSPGRGYQIEGVNRGELTIKLVPRDRRRSTITTVMARLREAYNKIPGVAFMYHQPTQEKMDESLAGLPALFGVMIDGPEQQTLVSLAAAVEQRMKGDKAFLNLVNNTKIPTPEILVRPRPRALARHQATVGDLFTAVRAAHFGLPAATLLSGRNQVSILLKTAGFGLGSYQSLRDLPVVFKTGEIVPLSQLADLSVGRRPAAVTRVNGRREVTIVAEVEGRVGPAVRRLREAFKKLNPPKGYRISMTGQYALILRMVRDFILIALAAVAIIYLILATHLQSFAKPFAILVTIPFALTGAVALLAVTRVGLDVSAAMGALTLIGIAVNNAIVLLDYAGRLERDGILPEEALRQAASVRLRPILMTASTTILALLPVALNPAVGSRIFQPFAVTVIGGLVTATLATLILVPVLAGPSPNSRV